MNAAENANDNVERYLRDALDKLIDAVRTADGITLNKTWAIMEPAFVAAKKREQIPQQIRNILVIRLDDIGDNVLMSGFLRELRRGFPASDITLVVNETVYNLVEHCPYVNEILAVKTVLNTTYDEWLPYVKEFCAANLWGKNIDFCLMPRWDLEIHGGDFLGYLSGARLRAAYSECVWQAKILQRESFDKLLTHVVFNSPYAKHEAERNFFFLEELGIPVIERHMELWLSADDRKAADRLLSESGASGKVLVAVTTGGSHATKIYPKEQFLAVLREIYNPQTMFVFVGAKKDGADADWIVERLAKGAAINLCGRTTIREAAAVIGFCGMYIGGDTGLKHLAAAQGKPVVEINRESRDKRFLLSSAVRAFAAWQVPTIICQPEHNMGECRIASMCIADEPHCITQVEPREIADAYRKLHSGNAPIIAGNETWQPNFAEYIPPNAKKVLELGAKNAKHARAFYFINPDAAYLSVANDEESAKRAVTGSRAVPAVADFATFNPMLVKNSGHVFDCIIIHDEWLGKDDEQKTAQKLAVIVDTLLAENGTVLYYFVNPACFRLVLDNLRNRATPFAAKRNLDEVKALLRTAGMELDCLFPRRSAEDEEYAALPAIKKIFAAAGELSGEELLQKFTPDMVRTYVMRAVTKIRPRLKIHSMIGEMITARVRLKEPNSFMARLPYIVATEKQGATNIESGKVFPRRVLIRQRMTSYNIDFTVREYETIFDAGYLLVGEIDDHPHIWRKDYEASRYIDFVGVHAMQVSTSPLADFLKNFNPHVYVFQNQLAQLPAKRDWQQEKNRPITVMFAALNRQQDWAPIMPAVNAVLKRHSRNVNVKVLFDREFFAALQTPNKRFIGAGYPQNFVPYEVYCRELHTADINLLPLGDNKINRVKSDLKFIESAGNGAAVLASPTVYENYVADGKTGLICRSPQDFAENLELLVENETLRRQIADNAYEYVKHNRLLCQHYEERLNVYNELAARLPELTQEARARIARVLQSKRA